MGIFDYDGFLVKTLVKAANMMIVSFFWLISCIPIVTVIPATAALFHTTTKVIRQNGTGVARDFFGHLRGSLKQGIALSVICIIFGLLLYTALDFGRQVWQTNILWTVYYAFGFFLALIFVTMVLFIPPALSRFECNVSTILRLSLYLASRNLLRSVWFVIIFAFIAFLVYIYPITLLILPGLYFDLICGGMEKSLNAFMKEKGLEDQSKVSSEHSSDKSGGGAEEELPELSSLELDKMMNEPENDSTHSAGDADE